MEPIKRLNRELVYKGSIIDMYKDTVSFPNGNTAYFDFIGHKGAAAALPVMDDGRIMLVKQYRNALDRFTLEIPAGGRNSEDEDYMTCAARELEEECGYHSDNLEFLISVITTVAFCNEKIEVYIARNLKKTEQNLDENEEVELVAFSVDELVQMIYKGTIEDAKTMSAILAYKDRYLR